MNPGSVEVVSEDEIVEDPRSMLVFVEAGMVNVERDAIEGAIDVAE